MDIFVSVGTGLNGEQEAFVQEVEQRLRALGLNPQTIGRTAYSADAPLHAVSSLLGRCSGMVVIALERYWFPNGVERRGANAERRLEDVHLPTAWNQIEAALAYGRGLPILVLVADGVRMEGLLEKGNDWYVQQVPVDPRALATPAFAGILDDWRRRLIDPRGAPSPVGAGPDPALLTVGQLFSALKPAHAWGTLVALATALGAAFALGARFSA